MPRIDRNVLYVVVNGVELSTLLVYDMRHIPKKLVKLANAGFYIPDLFDGLPVSIFNVGQVLNYTYLSLPLDD